jgi:hypothetical protein
MLLPVEDKKQNDFAATASSTAERTASFCSRNPSTCDTGRDLWTLFVRKAEYGMELGARLVREQLIHATTEPAEPMQNNKRQSPLPALAPSQPSQPVRIEPASTATTRQDQPQARRTAYPMDNPSRWR